MSFKRTTLQDVARETGYTINTISRALKDKEDIAPDTRRRIKEAARRLGYRPHLVARSLASGRSSTIGIVVFDLTHSFFSQTVTEIISSLHDRGYFSNVSITNIDPGRERECIETLTSLNVDGLILCPASMGGEFEEFLLDQHTPVVCIGNRLSERWSYVGINERGAMEDAVIHIHRRGYNRILYVSPPLPLEEKTSTNQYTLLERYRGYRGAMERLGLLPRVIRGKDYLRDIDAALADSPRDCVILCSSDNFALHALMHLRSRGVRIPADIGLMGFDNINTLEYIEPRLATVDYHIPEFGRQAVEVMISHLEGRREPQQRIVAHKILPGETIRSVAG